MPSADERAQAAAIAREVRELAESATKDIATGVMDAAIAGTRVATGLTRGSWAASRGAPRAEGVGDRTASGVATARASQERSRSEIADYDLDDGKLFVSNPEGNAERLNDGIDAGFVQRAIRQGVAVGGAKAAVRAAAASLRRGPGRGRVK
ncbi:MAG: hypothetical protein OXC08_12100 [Thiotrichales bacterium]|nr:hypothetical protein [Thiotrichales bacterium]